MKTLSEFEWDIAHDKLSGNPYFQAFQQQFILAAEGTEASPSLIKENYNNIVANQDAYSAWGIALAFSLPRGLSNKLNAVIQNCMQVDANTPKSTMEQIGTELGNIFRKARNKSRGPSVASVSALPTVKRRTNALLITYHLNKDEAPPGQELIKIPADLKIDDPILDEDTQETTLMDAMKKLYNQAYQDQLEYSLSGEKFLLPPLSYVTKKIDSDKLYGPAVLIHMLLNPPGHRMKREDLYEKIGDAVLESITNDCSEKELELLSKELLSGADVEDKPTGERLILPKEIPVDSDLTITACAHKSQAKQAEKVAAALSDAFKSRGRDLSAEGLVNRLKTNIKAVENITIEEDSSFVKTLDPKDQRRFRDFMDALENGDPNTLPSRVFANGAIAISSSLENRLETYLMMRGPGNNNPELSRLITIVADMKILIEKAMPVVKTDTRLEGVPPPSVKLAVVDQFPQEEANVHTVAGKANIINDPDHGLTVAKIAEISGRGRVDVNKWSTNVLKNCFDELKEDNNIEVVNFSSALQRGEDADYQAFYDLCLQKEVVVALGNNGRLLTAENKLTARAGAEQGSLPYIEDFLQGFTEWLQKEGQSPEDLKLTICENYRMDKSELTERSSSIAEGHPLYSNIVRVRGDCIINPVTFAVESGTSYVAPMVAGALASVPKEKRERFRQELCKCQILAWDHMVQSAITNEQATPASSSRPHLRFSLFEAAGTDKIAPPGLGSDSSSGASQPSIREADLTRMQRIMPVFGETQEITIAKPLVFKV